MEKFDTDHNLSTIKQFKKNNLRFATTPRFIERYKGNYEQRTFDLIRDSLNRGGSFIDIGAHHGYFSTFVYPYLRQKMSIHAFEPDPDNYAILKQNIEINKLKNVIAVDLVASNKTGLVDFLQSEASDNSGILKHPSSGTYKKIRAKSITLDKYVKEHKISNISVLKIDTEGSELEVLQGAENTLRSNPNIVVIFELNPKTFRKHEQTISDIHKFLNSVGHETYFISDSHSYISRLASMSSDWPQHMKYEEHVNVLTKPKDKSLSIVWVSHSGKMTGGGEKSFIELVKEAKRRGYFGHCVLPSAEGMEKELDRLGVSYEIIPFSHWTKGNLAENSNTISSVATRKIANRLNVLNPHVVVSNTVVHPWAAIACTMTSTKHCWFVREYGLKDHGLAFINNEQRAFEIVHELSDLIVANSKSVKSHIEGYRPTNTKSPIVVSYPHVPVANLIKKYKPTFISANLRSVGKVAKMPLKLLMIGGVTESKGQFEAVKALADLHRAGYYVQLTLIGNTAPNYKAKIDSFAKHNGIMNNVEYLGFVSNPHNHIQSSHVLLMCSKSEAFGRVTLEAMACGTPVIGANTGGTPELIVNNVTGFIYKKDSTSDLKNKISKFIDNPKLVERMGKAAQEHVKQSFGPSSSHDALFKPLLDLAHSKEDKHPYEVLSTRFNRSNYLEEVLSPLTVQIVKDSLAELYETKKVVDTIIPQRLKSSKFARRLTGRL